MRAIYNEKYDAFEIRTHFGTIYATTDAHSDGFAIWDEKDLRILEEEHKTAYLEIVQACYETFKIIEQDRSGKLAKRSTYHTRYKKAFKYVLGKS